MARTAAIAILGVALAGAAAPNGAEVNDPPRRSTDLPRPRDGDIAVQEELDAARKAGTIAAYDLFLARHPDHPLAEVARRERALLRR
jgi:hypothetical protein